MRHPALIMVLAWMAVLGLAAVRGRRDSSKPVGDLRLLLWASVACIVAYCAIVIWYTFETAYFDAAEPTITAVASVFSAGKPLYPALDAPERYAHIYGPMLFVAHAVAFQIAGPGILASKMVGALAILSSLVLGYRVFLARAGARTAVLATCACTLVYMYFGNATFWTRSDPLLIFCAAAALAAAHLRSPLVSFVLLGVLLGVSVNLKLTGPLYILPIVPIALSRHGVRFAPAGAMAAAIVAVAPFLLPQVSVRNYAGYVMLSAANGLLPEKVRENVEWAVFLGAPVAAVLWGERAAQGAAFRPWTTALAAAVAGVALASAKPGGGAFHLLPFVPMLAYAVASAPGGVWRQRPVWTLTAAFGIAAVLVAAPRQMIFLRTVAGRDLGQAVADVARFADAHPSKRIAVGYAGTSYASHARPEIVFRTGEYLLDAPAVQEHRLSGLPVPEATIRAIRECHVEYWLVPPDAPPFLVPSAYAPYGPPEVFPDTFRAAFLERYHLVNRAGGFDVWQCRPGSDPVPSD